MRIAIVGGGIGGMTLALALANVGLVDVDVFEAAPVIRELGVGINILPHAVRELDALGLMEALSATGIPTGELVFARSAASASGPSRADWRPGIAGPSSRSTAGGCSASCIVR